MLLFVLPAEFIIYAIDYFSYKKIIQFIVALGIAIILLGEGDITYNRNKIVSDDALLWLDNIDKAPGLSRPHGALGTFYFKYNAKEKALQEYEKAILLNNFGGSNVSSAIQEYNMGLYYFTEMQDDRAMEHFTKSSKVFDDIKKYILIAKIQLRRDKIKEVGNIIGDKLKKYPDKPELLELYGFILLKEGRINDAQYFARKLLAINSNSLTALEIMAQTCFLKKNYAGAISYWKSVQSLFPQNAYANLALIQLYAKIKDTKMLDQEMRLLFYLQGSLNFNEYIKQLRKDEKLLIYIPKIENYSFIIRKCYTMN
jgi:tetratricopeptide (TPR) repeat protein